MPTLVDLINQVQKILPIRYGGTGNDGGYATERLILPYMNDTGADLEVGTLVKLYGAYDDRRVIKTTTANEAGAIGVVVGRFILAGETAHQLEEVDAENLDTVAVCVSGRCRVQTEGTVAIGQYAYVSDTDGKAKGASFIDVGAIGMYETSTSGAGVADIRLYGTPTTPGMVGAIVAVLGDGVTTLQVNTMGDVVVPFNLTLTSVTMLSTTSGSCVIDIYNDTYGNFPPTDLDSITAAAPPTLSAAIKSQDSTLTGWTVALTGGTTLRFNVESASSLTQVTVQLAFIRR